MRMTVGQLRRIVREALERRLVSEAPLSDDPIPPVVDARTDQGRAEFEPNLYKQIGKFFNSKNYRDKAEYTFKMFPQEVFVVNAVINDEHSRYSNKLTRGGRLGIWDPEEGLALLEEMGVEVDLDRLRSKLEAGATMFVNVTGGLSKGALPTPWMMLHAVFDNDDFVNQAISEIRDAVFDIITDSELSSAQIARRATMKSARDMPRKQGQAWKDDNSEALISSEDIVRELIVQTIVDSRGLNFMLSPDHPLWRKLEGDKPMSPEVTKKLTALKNEIDALDIRKRFHEAVKGKVIAVATGTYA